MTKQLRYQQVSTTDHEYKLTVTPASKIPVGRSNITLLIAQLVIEIYSSLQLSTANGVSRTALNSVFNFNKIPDSFFLQIRSYQKMKNESFFLETENLNEPGDRFTKGRKFVLRVMTVSLLIRIYDLGVFTITLNFAITFYCKS